MGLYSKVVLPLLGLLALWSIIEAGVATKVAAEFYKIKFFRGYNYGNVGSYIRTFRNGAAVLAFDGFLTFFISLGFLAAFLTGHVLAPMVLLPVLAALFLLWLGGAAAYSNGFNNLGYDACSGGGLCSTIKAAVAFAWLGWITLLLLLAALAYFLVRPHHDDDQHPSDAYGHHTATTTTTTSTQGGGRKNIFALGGLGKKKNNATAANPDVEKVQQQQPIQTHPYPQQQGTSTTASPAFPTAAPGAAAAAGPTSSESAAAGYHGQSPSQQAFAGAYGVPQHQQQAEGAATYNSAQAYAQQQPYEGQPVSSPTSMPQPQAPTGWSVSPLGSQPQAGAAPTAEIVAGEARPAAHTGA
ncbi:hypothetical protein OC861_000432 [Tilletia horrida]|nr:hypothetical protein OC861_000432 [Tilletia horrida]